MNIYCVMYSEESGYVIRCQKDAARGAAGTGAWYVNPELGNEAQMLEYRHGWRATEEEAVQCWRDEGIAHARKLRELADRVEETARSQTPVSLPDPVFMPTL